MSSGFDLANALFDEATPCGISSLLVHVTVSLHGQRFRCKAEIIDGYRARQILGSGEQHARGKERAESSAEHGRSDNRTHFSSPTLKDAEHFAQLKHCLLQAAYGFQGSGLMTR